MQNSEKWKKGTEWLHCSALKKIQQQKKTKFWKATGNPELWTCFYIGQLEKEQINTYFINGKTIAQRN